MKSAATALDNLIGSSRDAMAGTMCRMVAIKVISP